MQSGRIGLKFPYEVNSRYLAGLIVVSLLVAGDSIARYIVKAKIIGYDALDRFRYNIIYQSSLEANMCSN